MTPKETIKKAGLKEKINDVEYFFQSAIKSSKSNDNHIGWTCSYIPEEILAASGFIPVRLLGNKNSKKADSYFPINFCPYVKSVWENILSDERLKGVVFTNSCDCMRRSYDICKTYKKDLPSYLLNVPRHNNQKAIKFFSENLFRLLVFLEKAYGINITSENLADAMASSLKKKSSLKHFSSIYKEMNGLIDIKTYFRIIELSFTSDNSIYGEELDKYIGFLKENPLEKKVGNRTRVLVIGNFIDEVRLWGIMDDLDLVSLEEDICNSNRYFNHPLIKDGNELKNHPVPELLDMLAVNYLNKPPCMRMADLGIKLGQVKEQIQKMKLSGVIYLSLKFCDNTLLFFPLLKQELDKMKIPSLSIELEHKSFSEGQVKTRLQAFLEML